MTTEAVVFEIVVRRVGGLECVLAQAADKLMALEARNRIASVYLRQGFSGGPNKAGVWRLTKRADGKRVRLAIYIQPAGAPSLN